MSSSTPKKSFESSHSPITSPSIGSTASRFRPSSSGHGAAQRIASSRHPPQRRGSAASIASSIGGTLDTAAADTTLPTRHNPQNAISTLLSPPIVRTGLVPHSSLPASSAHRPPSARDIPAVTLTSIPHVEPSAFQEYLSQVGPVFEAFHRAKAANEEASTPQPQPSASVRETENEDEFAAVFGRHVRTEVPTSPTSPMSSMRPGSVTSPLSPEARRVSRFAASRRATNMPTPLSTVPNVYFEEDFHLENPRIFDVVSEFAEIVPPNRDAVQGNGSVPNGSANPPRRRALHTNAILQEKLSWYMDTVEVHLISSIAGASTSFFAALGSLKELQGEAEDSIEQIKTLRAALQNLDSQMAMGGLEIVSLRQKRENLRRLGQSIVQLSEVVEQAKKCETLVDEGDVETATTQIASLERLIAGEPTDQDLGDGKESYKPRFDLRQMKALSGISEGISGLRVRIGQGFEDRFKDSLLSDMRQHVKSVPTTDTLQRWANASFRSRPHHTRKLSRPPSYLDKNESLRPDLTSALLGLTRAGHTARATTGYREAVMREIKSMLRQHLPSSSDDDADSMTSASTRGGRKLSQQEKSSILARNLRALDAEAIEDLLVKVYTSVGEALRRLGYQVKVLLDVTSSMESTIKETRKSDDMGSGSLDQATHIQDEVTQALDLSSLLGQAVDTVQGQIVKILKVRREENTHLPLSHFLRYFVLNRLFADECEAVSSRSGDALKEVVNSQIKDFVNVMAEREKQEIRRTLEQDRWEAKDFDSASSVVLDRVLEGMTTTPKAWTDYTALWDSADTVDSSSLNRVSTNGETANSGKVRSATIDEQRYILVNSAQSALSGIDTFAHLLAAIPAVTSDTASHLLAYLKLFNSHACQLILGAGATRSAGLKNITSKHLALASQACSFIVALLPYVRELVRRHLSPSTANNATVLAEFDRVKRLFQDHQTSIHEKLVEIMSARSAAHLAGFRTIDFDALASQSVEPPCKPVEDLCKETGTLHRVLSRHVSDLDLKMIMVPIFAAYKEEWSQALEGIGVKTDAGKQRLLADIDALSTRLSKLHDSTDVGNALVAVVKTKFPSEAPPSANAAVAPSASKGSTTDGPPNTEDSAKQASSTASDTADSFNEQSEAENTQAPRTSEEIIGQRATDSSKDDKKPA